MTCIVGLEHKGLVYIGGDSAGTSSSMHQTLRKDKKVFTRGEFIFGFSGSFRMGQLLQHTVQLPDVVAAEDIVSFMVNEFVSSVRDTLEQENEHHEGSEKLSPYFLVGIRGKLFNIQSDYQVGQPEAGFDAVGSGADVAKGAMLASVGTKDPEERIRKALQASATGNAAVRPPFHVLSVGKKRFW